MISKTSKSRVGTSPITGLQIHERKVLGRKKRYTVDEHGEYQEVECMKCNRLLPVKKLRNRAETEIPYSWCEDCTKANNKRYRKANRDKISHYKSVVKKIQNDIVSSALNCSHKYKNLWDGKGEWHIPRNEEKKLTECPMCHTTTWRFYCKGLCYRCYNQNYSKARWSCISSDPELKKIMYEKQIAAHKVRMGFLREVIAAPENHSLEVQNAVKNLEKIKRRKKNK